MFGIYHLLVALVEKALLLGQYVLVAFAPLVAAVPRDRVVVDDGTRARQTGQRTPIDATRCPGA